MDAQAIGSLRVAFLQACTGISKSYPYYKESLVYRLRNVLLYHHDAAVRLLSAESLSRILAQSPDKISVTIKEEIKRVAGAKEARIAHGSLLLLTKLSQECFSTNLKADVSTSSPHNLSSLMRLSI